MKRGHRYPSAVAVLAAASVVVFGTGCGESSEKAAPPPSPSPSATVDRWGEEMCEYLYGQDPNNEFTVGMAATYARQSSSPDLVALADQAERAGSQNLLRGWCQQHLPDFGVTPAPPQ